MKQTCRNTYLEQGVTLMCIVTMLICVVQLYRTHPVEHSHTVTASPEPFVENTLTLENANKYQANMDILIKSLAYRLAKLIPASTEVKHLADKSAALKATTNKMKQTTANLKNKKIPHSGATLRTLNESTKQQGNSMKKNNTKHMTGLPVISTSLESFYAPDPPHQLHDTILTIRRLAKGVTPPTHTERASTGDGWAGGALSTTALPQPLQIYIGANTKLYHFYNNEVVPFVNSQLTQKEGVHEAKKKHKKQLDAFQNKANERRAHAKQHVTDTLAKYKLVSH
jgi:hypothetical protein